MSNEHPVPRQHTPPTVPSAGAAQGRLHAYLLSKAQGSWPATSALLGHPPTLESLEFLNFLPGTKGLPPGVPGVADLVLVLTTPGNPGGVGGVIHAVITGPLSRGLLGLLLDGDVPTASAPPTPTSPAEAGLLAGLAAAALEDLGQGSLAIQDVAVVRDDDGAPHGPPNGLPAESALGCSLTLRCGPPNGSGSTNGGRAATGQLLLLMNTTAAGSLRESAKRWQPPPSDGGRDLPLTADLVLARTELAWSRLTALEPGDAIVFPCPAPPDDHWPIHLAVADQLFGATLRRTEDGREIEIRGSSMNPSDSSPPSLSGDPSDPSNSSNSSDPSDPGDPSNPRDPGNPGNPGNPSDPSAQNPALPARGDLLDRLPVTLTAVLGRVELTAGDVARLAPGVVISLDHPVGGAVQLRAGSRSIGIGELVEVDGSLGVRLTELTL